MEILATFPTVPTAGVAATIADDPAEATAAPSPRRPRPARSPGPPLGGVGKPMRSVLVLLGVAAAAWSAVWVMERRHDPQPVTAPAVTPPDKGSVEP